MQYLSKSLKFKISLSIIWLVIMIGFSCTSGGYRGFHSADFIVFMIFSNLPILVYWLGFWIWGERYLTKCFLNMISQIRKIVKLAYDKIFVEHLPEPKELSIQSDEHLVGPSEQIHQTINLPDVHPWRRFLARWADYFWWGYALSYVLEVINFQMPNSLPLHMEIKFLSTITIATWAAIEPIFLSFWGKTPGKYMLNMSVVKSNGTKLSFSDALGRSGLVWVRGLALGIPLINLYTLTKSYKNLLSHNTTPWDEQYGTAIVFSKLRWFGVLLVMLTLVAYPYTFYKTIQDHAATTAFNKKYTDLEEKLEEISKNYVHKIKMQKWRELFIPNKLINDNHFYESSNKLKISESLLDKAIYETNLALDNFEDGIDILDFSDKNKDEVMALLKQVHELKIYSDKAFAISKNYMYLCKKLLMFLYKNRGGYIVSNNKFVFKTKELLTTYKELAEQIDNLE